MAKKLVHEYTFIPSQDKVVINYVYRVERILLITNVTKGITIYVFNDEDLKINSVSYDYALEQTTLTLAYDCAAMSSTDKLQILVEDDYAKFEPSETFVDPVSKFRVSQPENLIDTDFEYGLQSTKWETLEMVKNIPTFFSRTGDSELSVVDITTVNGSDVVTITTTEAHNFLTGTPVILIGTKNIACDGTFVITTVIDTVSFQYKAKAVINTTGSIRSDFTQVFPGSIYQGTEFDLQGIDAITTSGSNNSTLTVKTEFPTDFEVGTSFFLTNSIGAVNLNIDATEVEPENFRGITKTVTNNVATGETGFSLGAVQPYIYTALEAVYFRNSEITVNASTGIESITFPTDHGITDNTYWLYVPGEGNTVIGGLTAYVAYVARVISPNSIYLTTVINSTTRVNLTAGGADGGVMRSGFLRCYRAVNASTSTEYINFNQAHGIASFVYQPVLFFNGSMPNQTISTSLHTPAALRYTRETTATAVRLSTAPNGAVINLTSGTANGVMVPVQLLPDYNTIYFANHGLSNDDSVVFTVLSGTAPAPLVSTVTYKVEVVSNDRVRFKDNDTLVLQNFTNIGTTTSQLRIEARVPTLFNDSIYSFVHPLRDGLEINYDNNGNTDIGGLTNGSTYYVFQRTQNTFKLATTSSGWRTNAINITNAVANAATNQITTQTNHGFNNGEAVQYLSSTPIGGLTSGAFYWVRVAAANRVQLHWTKAGSLANNDIVNITGPISGFSTLRAATLVDITAAGTGTHIFKALSSNASDGVYAISRIVDKRTFVLQANSEIPPRELPLGLAPEFLDLYNSQIKITAHSLKTGTSITYSTDGGAIGGLADDTVYYVIRMNRDWIKLATSQANAESGENITLTSLGSGTHLLTTASISGEVLGSGTVSVSQDDTKVTGVGTNFTAIFSPGDTLFVYVPETYVLKTVTSVNTTTDVFTSTGHGMIDGSPVIMAATTAPTGTVNGHIYYTRSTDLGTPANEFQLHPTYDDAIANTNIINVTTAGTTVRVNHIATVGSTAELIIRYVNSATEIIITEPSPSTYTSASYSVGSNLYVRADGFALHRPYDGGVELIPSTNPDATMIRQTRKYFRYQSGKGIQVSFAVNFSPTTTFESLTVSLDQSKIDKCERDTGYIIDGLAYDISLGTNYNARFLGFAEQNSVDVSQLVKDTIADLRDEVLLLTEVDDSVTAETRVGAFFTELLNILDNDRDAASALSFTNPSGATSAQIAAKDKILANIDFIIAEINAYVEVTYAPTDHAVEKCSRDVKYALEGFAYDILYGGNQATYNGANLFLYYDAEGDFGIVSNHITQTVGAYTRLKAIIGDIVEGVAITPSAGNTLTQDTSGNNATATETTILETLADIIIDTINSQALPVGLTKTDPDVTWASQELQDAKTDIETNKATLIATVVTSDIGLTTATCVTRNPHRMTVGLEITVSGALATGGIDVYNGVFKVIKIVDPYTFQINLGVVPPEQQAAGLVEFYVNAWQNSRLKCGLFDDQNGLYFEYDGQELACVRRSSVQQISGNCAVQFKSGEIVGNNTRFSSQLAAGDKVVIKGQTYLVTDIVNNTLMYILPTYRGVSNSEVIITKTVDSRVPQSEWNIDVCDGTGPTGYVLDINKIQMAYMDYSWYGAGKVRFGFKDQRGKVIYCHEFIHNNKFTEAYMRSGNLPARYEVENAGKPTYVPSLAHWGTSVIMDGRFDDDNAYVFTASSNPISITGSATVTVSARAETQQFYRILVNNQYRNAGYGLLIATPSAAFNQVPSNVTVSGANIPAGTRTRLPQDNQINPRQPYQPSVSAEAFGVAAGTRNLLLIDRQPTGTIGTNSNYTVTLSSAVTPVVYEQPLISIRLAPSVDTGTPGLLGQREIINRMQLILSTVGVLSTHSAEILLKINGQLNNNDWKRVTNPSLSQLIYHSTADTIIGGTTVFSFRAQGGTGTTARTPVITTAELGDLATLGNSILGGDNAFPDGPDVLTVVAKLLEDPSTVAANNPFNITGRISWSESQA